MKWQARGLTWLHESTGSKVIPPCSSTHTYTHKLYPKRRNRWNSSLSSQCNLHCKSDLNLTSSLLIAFLYITCCLEYTNRFESFNWIISNQRQITIKIFARATILTIFHAWTVLKILNNAAYICTRYLCIKHHEIETLLFLLKTAKHSLSHDSSKAHLSRHESNFSFSKARQTWFSFPYRISQELQKSLSKNFAYLWSKSSKTFTKKISEQSL